MCGVWCETAVAVGVANRIRVRVRLTSPVSQGPNLFLNEPPVLCKTSFLKFRPRSRGIFTAYFPERGKDTAATNFVVLRLSGILGAPVYVWRVVRDGRGRGEPS